MPPDPMKSSRFLSFCSFSVCDLKVQIFTKCLMKMGPCLVSEKGWKKEKFGLENGWENTVNLVVTVHIFAAYGSWVISM